MLLNKRLFLYKPTFLKKDPNYCRGRSVEVLEIYDPFFHYLEEGYNIHIASPSKKKLQIDVHDFIGWDTLHKKKGILIEAQVAFENVYPKEYNGLIILGSRTLKYILLYEKVPRIMSHFFEANELVAAICHASLVLTTFRQFNTCKTEKCQLISPANRMYK